MNWGTNLFLALGIFVVGMVFVGIYMVNSDSDTLIDTDYYEQGLNYDEKFVKKQNLANTDKIPAFQVKGDSLILTFKEDNNKGNIIFKRPSDQNLDFTVPFQISGEMYSISTQTLEKGNWQIELDWVSNGQEFYYEQNVRF